VFIQKSQLGGGSPIIRGFSANSVLIVVDGVRMNNAIYRSGNLQNVISIDPNTIEEAEVIFGPGSIIYGSDALGGVMDFHTQKIDFTEEKRGKLSGKAMMRYSTANNERTAHADLMYSRKNWGSFTSFSYSDFDDLRMGSVGHDEYRRLQYVQQNGNQDMMVSNSEPNIQRFSGYRQYNFAQKLSYRPSENITLNYGFHLANTSDIPRYDRLIEYRDDSTLNNAEWYYGPQFWMLHTLGVDLEKSTLLYDNARITLAYQGVEESRHDRKFGKEELRSRTETVDAYSLNVDLDKILSNKSSLFYGVEGIYNYVGSTAESTTILTNEKNPESTRYPDGGSDYMTASAYMNFKTNLHSRLTLQAGIRYSYIHALSRFIDTTFYAFPYDEIKLNTGAFNGSIGIVFRAAENSRINLNLASGFRAPNIDDLAKVFDSEPGNVVVPNNNLKPEYAYNADLGLVRSFSSRVKVEITGFYTHITNLLVRRDDTFDGQDSIIYDGTLSKVQSVQNAASGWLVGMSFDLKADITERIGFRTSLNYIKGEDDDGEAIRHVTPIYGSTGFSYSARKIKIEAWVDYNGQIAYTNMAPSEREKPYMYATDEDGNPYSPSWYTLNLKGYYQINPFLQVNAGIDNILDVRYRPYSSGIVAPGRNFVVALRATF
jgi:hemoglobin/transferrin/lactoferrin receptor protein